MWPRDSLVPRAAATHTSKPNSKSWTGKAAAPSSLRLNQDCASLKMPCCRRRGPREEAGISALLPVMRKTVKMWPDELYIWYDIQSWLLPPAAIAAAKSGYASMSC